MSEQTHAEAALIHTRDLNFVRGTLRIIRGPATVDCNANVHSAYSIAGGRYRRINLGGLSTVLMVLWCDPHWEDKRIAPIVVTKTFLIANGGENCLARLHVRQLYREEIWPALFE